MWCQTGDPSSPQHSVRSFAGCWGATTSLSFGFHPQTNGQTEHVNQEMETGTNLHCSLPLKRWSLVLPPMPLLVAVIIPGNKHEYLSFVLLTIIPQLPINTEPQLQSTRLVRGSGCPLGICPYEWNLGNCPFPHHEGHQPDSGKTPAPQIHVHSPYLSCVKGQACSGKSTGSPHGAPFPASVDQWRSRVCCEMGCPLVVEEEYSIW